MLAVVVLVFVVGYLWLRSTSTVRQAGAGTCAEVTTTGVDDPEIRAQTRDGVCATISALEDAWAGQDAEAYGAGFTEDATYTTFAGTYYSGRDDIVNSHAALYEGPLSGTGLVNHYLSLRVLSDGVALLTTRGDTHDGTPPEEPGKVQTYTLVNTDEGWQVAAFQNTARQPVMEQIQFRWQPDTIPAAER